VWKCTGEKRKHCEARSVTDIVHAAYYWGVRRYRIACIHFFYARNMHNTSTTTMVAQQCEATVAHADKTFSECRIGLEAAVLKTTDKSRWNVLGLGVLHKALENAWTWKGLAISPSDCLWIRNTSGIRTAVVRRLRVE
jgi:hypothetical protein